MGIHKYGRGTVQRMSHAHLERKENGDIYGVFKVEKDKVFEYCFIGDEVGKLTLAGEVIGRHPKFKNIVKFEDWCRVYTAEHDI